MTQVLHTKNNTLFKIIGQNNVITGNDIMVRFFDKCKPRCRIYPTLSIEHVNSNHNIECLFETIDYIRHETSNLASDIDILLSNCIASNVEYQPIDVFIILDNEDEQNKKIETIEIVCDDHILAEFDMLDLTVFYNKCQEEDKYYLKFNIPSNKKSISVHIRFSKSYYTQSISMYFIKTSNY